jgi:hypothetical protein
VFDGNMHGVAPSGSVEQLVSMTHDTLNTTLPYTVPKGTFEHISLSTLLRTRVGAMRTRTLR